MVSPGIFPLTVSNSTITGNAGGGIFNSGTLMVSNSTITANSVGSGGYGGGIYNGSGTLTVSNSTIAGNIGNYYGGGIYNNNGKLTVANCTISANSTNDYGGGIYSSGGGTLTATNCTFNANVANHKSGFYDESGGGGIGANGGTLLLSNCTFTANLASQTSHYNVTGCISWNCILVPGVINSVPAVCPNCACLPVLGELPGWKLSVFTATLRPFTEIDVSSRASRSDLRGLARDDLIFPNAFDPAFNRTVPLTATFWSSFAAKVLPTGSCEEMELAVLTLSIVPAGIVAAFKDEAATEAYVMAITLINFLRIIFV